MDKVAMRAAFLDCFGEDFDNPLYEAEAETWKLAWSAMCEQNDLARYELTSEQIARHTLLAGECPPNSQVILVSSIMRLETIKTGEAASACKPQL